MLMSAHPFKCIHQEKITELKWSVYISLVKKKKELTEPQRCVQPLINDSFDFVTESQDHRLPELQTPP